MAAPSAKLSKGKTSFGCFAWSPETKAAACVTGRQGLGVDAEYLVRYVGTNETPTKLGEAIDAKTAAAVDDVLAKKRYEPLPAEKKALSQGKPLEVGKATLTWTQTPKSRGGDNTAPTDETKIAAKCGGRDVVLFKSEIEGGDPAVRARSVGEHVIVELTNRISREGESSEQFDAFVLDTASCSVPKTR